MSFLLVQERKVSTHPDFLFAACLVEHYYSSRNIRPSALPFTNITWSPKKTDKASGVYCLRTSRNDLNEQHMYTMLTDIEDAFRCMKSELGLRPLYHHIERRCDGHIFITLLAYHVLHTIRFKLREKGSDSVGKRFELNFHHRSEYPQL